jgi:hypothetical protein
MEHIDENGGCWRLSEMPTPHIPNVSSPNLRMVEVLSLDEPTLGWRVGFALDMSLEDLKATHGADGLNDLIWHARLHGEPIRQQPDVPGF